MKKKLNVDAISNELQEASAFFGKSKDTLDNESIEQSTSQSTEESTPESVTESTEQLADQSIDKPTVKSANQPTDVTANSTTIKSTKSRDDRLVEWKNKRASPEPTEQPPKSMITKEIDRSSILGKPKAFYISEKQDDDLNVAVTNISAMLKGKVAHKIDRSTIVRLLLEESRLNSKKTAERLADRLINRLISQLTG